jgi:CheY-like chemotaxis protein
VIESRDATEALAHLETQPFDVLVTDQSIPGMLGSELAARALSRRPSLRIVFASGYDPNGSTQGISGAIFLSKPYDEKALKSAMDSALQPR